MGNPSRSPASMFLSLLYQEHFDGNFEKPERLALLTCALGIITVPTFVESF